MYIIANGQEELIRRMVAPPLPSGWAFEGARVEGASIVARYGQAPDGAVAVMQLAHPATSEAKVTTRRFAVHWRLSPSARDAPSLARAVLVSLRASEEDFVWSRTHVAPPAPLSEPTPPEPAPPAPPEPPPAPPASPPVDPEVAAIEAALGAAEVAALAPGAPFDDDGSVLTTVAADEWGSVLIELARPDGSRLEVRLNPAQRSVVATWSGRSPGGADLRRHPQTGAQVERWFTAVARLFPHLQPAAHGGVPPTCDALTLDPVGVAEFLAPEVEVGGEAFVGHRLVAVRASHAAGPASALLGRVLLEFATADARESLEVIVAPAASLDPVFASHAGVGVGLLHFGLADREGVKAQAALVCSGLAALLARKLAPAARVAVPERSEDVRLIGDALGSSAGEARPAVAAIESHDVLNLNLDAECGQRCTFCPIKSFVPSHDGGAEELRGVELQIREAASRGQVRARLNGIDPLAFSHVLDVASALRAAGFSHLQVMGPGRRFADASFRRAFLERSPAQTEVVVPLYGVSAAVHDAVTGAPGSHAEVLAAIEGLRAELGPSRLGVATVITRQNVDEFVGLVAFARSRSLPLWPQLPYPLRQTRRGAYADSALPEGEIVARVLASLQGVEAEARAACLFALATAIRHPCVLWRAQRFAGLGAFEAARSLPRRALAGVSASDEHNPRKGDSRSLATLHVARSPCPEAPRCALLPACAGDHYDAYGDLFGLGEFAAVGVWDLA